MKKYIIGITLFLSTLLISCTDLTETLYDRIDATTFYKSKDEIEAGLAKAYRQFKDANKWRTMWGLQGCTTDQGTVPVRSDGGFAGEFQEMTMHQWNSNSRAIKGAWSAQFSCVGVCNSLLENIDRAKQTVSGLEPVIAEIRAIRAYCYLIMCDTYGNVPIVTVARIPQNDLPTNKTRKEVYAFVESELIAAIKDLPFKRNVDANYYPRFTKEAAQSTLAKLYLNAEVYTGTARWDDCIKQCDEVINSKAYSLTQSIAENFSVTNEKSTENIIAGACNNDVMVGGNYDIVYGLHPLHQLKYGLPSVPFGGTSALEEHYNLYENGDFRKTFFLAGPQFYDDGKPLVDPKTGIQLDCAPIINLYNAPMSQGIRVVKYQPDKLLVGTDSRNDYVFLRYADVLLMKAECLYRTGKISESQTLVNSVRSRNFTTPSPFANMTLNNILEERSREFAFESNYRTDLIRFGKFLSTTHHLKPTPDDPAKTHLLIFPVPQVELNANPKLTQNPGY